MYPFDWIDTLGSVLCRCNILGRDSVGSFHFYGTCRVKRTKKNVGRTSSLCTLPTAASKPPCKPTCVAFNFAANVSFLDLSLFLSPRRYIGPLFLPPSVDNGPSTRDTRDINTEYRIRREGGEGRGKTKAFFKSIRDPWNSSPSPPLSRAFSFDFQSVGRKGTKLFSIYRETRCVARHTPGIYSTPRRALQIFERGRSKNEGRGCNLIWYPPLLIR